MSSLDCSTFDTTKLNFLSVCNELAANLIKQSTNLQQICRLINCRLIITPPPHTHTHYWKQRHENKHSRIQGKRTKVKILSSEERKQSKKHCSPIKLESKKKG